MKYAIIDAVARTVSVRDLKTFDEAKQAAGLPLLGVDHGGIRRGLSIVVHEFCLFVPKNEQHYFSIRGRLYGGGAVVYAFGEDGETTDVVENELEPTTFYRDANAVEIAIIRGEVRRPRHSVNNEPPTWMWPQPKPGYIK